MKDFSNPKLSRVNFRPEGTSLEVPIGTTLLQAAAQAGIMLQSACGGHGACGKCRIKVLSPQTEPTPDDRRHFTEAELAQGFRLACRFLMTGEEVVVEVPVSSRLVKEKIALEAVGREIEVEPNLQKIFLRLPPPTLSDQRADLSRVLDSLAPETQSPQELAVLKDLPARLRQEGFAVTAVLSDEELIEVEAGDTSDKNYGIAFDIGSTTIVGYLMNLETGEELAVASLINPQVTFGDDIISRIAHASQGKEQLAQLQTAVVGAINDITLEASRKAKISPHHIYEMTAVGNTCMTHLLLGINPASLATLPYVPANTGERLVPAEALGIKIAPRGRVLVLPNIAGFVGADTVGVILASGLEENQALRIDVDIGTNGEVVAVKAGRMVACSTAAGPAFEGARISQGMRAAAGAIDRVDLAEISAKAKFEQLLQVHTIDDAPPRGLCGSGLVDTIAALRAVGLINPAGRLLDVESLPAEASAWLSGLEGTGGQVRFRLSPPVNGPGVFLTSRDVRELQLAKAAICAGILTLLEVLGASLAEVEELLLAGAFGNYIRRENALAIGLIPALPLERIKPIGNAAGLGAKLALASRRRRILAKSVAQQVEYVELSERPEFYKYFSEAMELAPIGG